MTSMNSQRTRESLALIVNPRSGGGRTARKLPRLTKEASKWFGRVELFETSAPRHAEILAKQAAESGFDVVAAVGGDGTASEVVNGLVPNGTPINSEVVFTVIPCGTGSDLVKTLKIPLDLSEALRVAANGETKVSDVILVEMTCEQTGDLIQRVSVNLAGFCSNGDVVARVNRSSKRLGGRVSFLLASLRTAVSYRAPNVLFEWENDLGESKCLTDRMLSVFLANAEYGGGGMWVGRGASMQDGKMLMTLLPPMGSLNMGLNVRRLYSGTISSIPGVIQEQVLSLRAKPVDGDTVRIDIDGEQPGILPASFSVVGKVLKVRGQW